MRIVLTKDQLRAAVASMIDSIPGFTGWRKIRMAQIQAYGTDVTIEFEYAHVVALPVPNESEAA